MATIIKADGPQASASGAKPIAFNYDDMVTHATAKLEQVRQQAGQILVEARREAEQIKQQAQQQGKAAALAEARKTVQQEVSNQLTAQLETLRPALQNAAAQMAQARLACMRQWEQNMVQLAAAIAEKVIRRELAAQPEIPLALVREALELAVGCQQIRIHLHPTDLAHLGDQVENVIGHMKQLGQTTLVDDPAIEPGSCLVETEFGQIDQQWQTQLNRIAEELS